MSDRLNYLLNKLDKLYELDVLEEAAINSSDLKKAKSKLNEFTLHTLLIYIFRDSKDVDHWCGEISTFLNDAIYIVRNCFSDTGSKFKKEKIKKLLNERLFDIDDFNSDLESNMYHITNRKHMAIPKDINLNNYKSFHSDFVNNIIDMTLGLSRRDFGDKKILDKYTIREIFEELWNKYKI